MEPEPQFTTKAGEFEGPLDLLLQLIEKRKLHISEVSLAQVADDYIAHLKQFEHLPKHEVANFLVIASTLILIKSIALLPTLETTPEETQDINDLQIRLALYEKFKSASELIKNLFGKNNIFWREETKHTISVFAPSTDTSLDSLSLAMRNVLANLPKPEKIPEVIVKKVISLEEVIGNLTKRIQSALSMKFSDFAKTTGGDRVGIIVSFLGMLELVKQGIIDVKQDELYQDINIESSSTGVPRYQ
ncbi:MAG: segregation/condensation protein A [Candidatus Vogelbacteria bacterium]|nr:segregation/condensation protein A [Candidatus Vogelbacteria bacterium]